MRLGISWGIIESCSIPWSCRFKTEAERLEGKVAEEKIGELQSNQNQKMEREGNTDRKDAQ